MCVMAQRSINPVADILVAIVLHGKKDYVKNTTHNIQRHVTGYLQSTPGKRAPRWRVQFTLCYICDRKEMSRMFGDQTNSKTKSLS